MHLSYMLCLAAENGLPVVILTSPGVVCLWALRGKRELETGENGF